jgi:hypothetical protein
MKNHTSKLTPHKPYIQTLSKPDVKTLKEEKERTFVGEKKSFGEVGEFSQTATTTTIEENFVI